MRSPFPALLGALALIVTAVPSVAQNEPLRKGFFIGFGMGGGGGEMSGPGQSDGGMGWLTLGGTVSQKIRLAADYEVQVPDGSAFTLGTSTLAVLFYPTRRSNFFLKGGVGAALANYNGNGPDGTGIGFGSVLGIGYDFRIGKKISITPQFTTFGGRTGDIEDDDGNFIANDVVFNASTLSVGVVFH